MFLFDVQASHRLDFRAAENEGLMLSNPWMGNSLFCMGQPGAESNAGMDAGSVRYSTFSKDNGLEKVSG